MKLLPRYFQRKPGEPPLFSGWPIWKNRWSRILPPPDDEPEMTGKEYVEQERDSHMH